MAQYQVVHLSSAELLLYGSVCVVFLGVFKLILHSKGVEREVAKQIDWSVPRVDSYAEGNSLFHCWDPRFKIFTLTLYCFCIAALHSLMICTAALVLSIGALLASGIPWDRSWMRVKAMAGFLFMFLFVLPFTVAGRPGETLFVIGSLEGLPFHSSGFLVAATIVVKAVAIALLMEPLFATAPLPVTLLAVSRLGLPVVICQMILLAHRYIHVFLQEMRRMYRGMKVRGFKKRTNLATMRSLGNLLGMLIVRSFDRTQRVYEAMLSRGYTGVFPTYTRFSARRSDWHKALVGLGLGSVLLLLDYN